MRLPLSICALALAALPLSAGRPAWATGTPAAGCSTIAAVVSGASEDLVVLADGAECGLRRGMVATVFRAGQLQGKLLVAETGPDRSVALILELAPGSTLSQGDRVERSLLRL